MVSSAFPNPDDPVAKEWHELAKLTGYKPKESELKTAAVAVAEPSSAEQEQSERKLLDDEDLEDDDEETKTPLHQNPFAKLVLAGAMVGTGVGALALFLATINGQVQQATTATSAEENHSSTTVDTQESEVGRLKTINGLGTQAQLLNQANQPSVRQTTQSKPGTPAQPAPAQAKPAQTRPASPTPTPMPIAARPLPVAPSPMMRSAPRTDPVVASAASFTAPNATPVDPVQQWETAKNLGSYGTGATAVLSTSVARTVTAPVPMDAPITIASASVPSPQAITPAPAIASSELIAMPSAQVAQPVSAASDLQYQSDVQALMTGVRQSVTQITPGATAAGTLRTPIAWAQDLDPEQQPQRISIELAQDIPATDGSPAIPAGSQLIARITAISENGMMQIEAQQAIVQTASGTQAVNLPPGAVLITGQGGNPLIAESREPGARNSLGDDIEVAAMGALGQVGSLLNRPANESTTTSPYLSSTNVTNGSTSIVGGILEGGFNALMESTQARQEQRQQEMQQRPNLWFVPAGQTVQVFVNAPVQMMIGQGV